MNVEKCGIGRTKAEKAVSTTINELLSRGLIDEDAYNNMLGCKSYDEIVNKVRKNAGIR